MLAENCFMVRSGSDAVRESDGQRDRQRDGKTDGRTAAQRLIVEMQNVAMLSRVPVVVHQ